MISFFHPNALIFQYRVQCINVIIKLTEHGQHEVEAVALHQGAVDGKSPQLQHPGTLLSGRCRFEPRLTPAEGDGGLC